jgi:hypothetical protein
MFLNEGIETIIMDEINPFKEKIKEMLFRFYT